MRLHAMRLAVVIGLLSVTHPFASAAEQVSFDLVNDENATSSDNLEKMPVVQHGKGGPTGAYYEPPGPFTLQELIDGGGIDAVTKDKIPPSDKLPSPSKVPTTSGKKTPCPPIKIPRDKRRKWGDGPGPHGKPNGHQGMVRPGKPHAPHGSYDKPHYGHHGEPPRPGHFGKPHNKPNGHGYPGTHGKPYPPIV